MILAPSNEWLFGLALLLALWLGWRRLSAVGREANGADWGNDWLNRLDGLARLFCRRFHRLDAAPLPVPASGGALLAANHISGLDPILMLAVCPRPLRFMVAKEEYNRWWLRWLYDRIGFIPVDRQGAPEKAFYAARKALAAGELIGVFPQGKVTPPDGPRVPLKRGVIMLADLAQAPIVPLRLSGIKGVGKIVKSVFMRSNARIEVGAPILVADGRDSEALRRLEEFITAPPEPLSGPDETAR